MIRNTRYAIAGASLNDLENITRIHILIHRLDRGDGALLGKLHRGIHFLLDRLVDRVDRLLVGEAGLEDVLLGSDHRILVLLRLELLRGPILLRI